MKIPYELIIYCSAGGGAVMAGLQYLKERRLKKEFDKDRERNEKDTNNLLKILKDENTKINLKIKNS